jgi:integrase
MQPVQPTKPQDQKRFRFNREKIEALLAPKVGPAVFYDTDVKGLSLRVQPSGKKLFFVLKKVAGKTHRRTIGTTFPSTTVENARKHAHNLLGAVAEWVADPQGPNPMLRPLPDSDDAPMTFNAAFQMYLKSPGKKTKNVTAENREKADERRQYIFDHCYTELQDHPIEEFTPTFMATYHKKLEKKYGPMMMNRAHEVLRATFNYLIRKGIWTNVNPAIGVERAPKRERAIILEDEQGQAFFDALDKDPNRDFAEWAALLLLTGVRTSNLYAAAWEELKLSRKPAVWEIPAAKSKNGKDMIIPLNAEAIALLKSRAARLHPQVELKDLKGWVFPSKFPSENDDPRHVVDFKNQWRRLMKTAGLYDKEADRPTLTRHDLRRTFVSRMLAQGVPLHVASAAAGHSSLAAMQPYARFNKGDVAKAVETGAAGMKKRIAEIEAEKKLLGA